jgi:hypothetical protein
VSKIADSALPRGARWLFPFWRVSLFSARATPEVAGDIERSVVESAGEWRGVIRPERFKIYRWSPWTSARVVVAGRVRASESGSRVYVSARLPALAIAVLATAIVGGGYMAIGGAIDSEPSWWTGVVFPVFGWLWAVAVFRYETPKAIAFLKRALER